MKKNIWYQGKIIHGKKIGKTLGFPTLNLDNPNVLKEEKKGVYAVSVKINDESYQGMLYYGPRLVLNETTDIVEIYVFDYIGQSYNDTISYQLIKFIRAPKPISSLAKLKLQLEEDQINTSNALRITSK